MVERSSCVAAYGIPMNTRSANTSASPIAIVVPGPVSSCSGACTSAERMSMRVPYESDSHSTTRPRMNGRRPTPVESSSEWSGSR